MSALGREGIKVYEEKSVGAHRSAATGYVEEPTVSRDTDDTRASDSVSASTSDRKTGVYVGVACVTRLTPIRYYPLFSSCHCDVCGGRVAIQQWLKAGLDEWP